MITAIGKSQGFILADESTDGNRSMATHDAKPSHSDIASLESAFASDPSSKAYHPLAEAYLALGRFMEAMVVCKKGVKAHPTDPAARVLMGRIYADQSKDRKALEELRAALELDPDHADANRLLGVMLLGQGDSEEGTRHLQNAVSAAPDDPRVLEACKKWGVDPPPPPPPPEPPPPPAQPEAGPGASPSSHPGAAQAPSQAFAPQGPPPMPAGVAGVAGTGQAPAAPGNAAGAPAPGQPTAPARPQAAPPAFVPAGAPPSGFGAPYAADEQAVLDDSLLDMDDPLESRSKVPMMATLAIVGVGALIMLGWWGWQARSAEMVRRADSLLAEAQELLPQGSYTNLLRVGELAEEALEYQRRGTLGATAHAYLAYVNVLRWGEHLDGEPYRELAARHLEASEAEGATLTVRFAAQAYYDFFSGETQEAIDELRAIAEMEGTTASHIFSALGYMYLWTGDLAEARRYLGRARELAPRDPRNYVGLGEVARRQDEARVADRQYARALTFDENHVDALLGQALIILDSPLLEDKHAEAFIDRILEVPEGQLAARQLAMARFARAQFLFAQGETSKAREEQEQALEVQPRNPDIHLMIGRRHFREEEYEAAAASIRRAIEIEPNRAGFHVDLARVLMAMPGREGAREAVQAVERALRSFPDNPSLHVLLGEAHEGAGDRDRALAAYEKANEVREGDYPEALLALGSLQRRERDFSAAKENLEAAEEAFERRANNRGRARAIVELGRMELQQGNMAEAMEILARALQYDSENPEAYYFLGRVLSTDRRRRDGARQAMEEYLRLAPSGEYVEQAQAILRRL